MSEKLRRLWRDYNLSIVLLAAFIVSWVLQGWAGWRKFSAEQLQHQQAPSVFGDDGYVWEFLATTFENWQSEFMQAYLASCRLGDSAARRVASIQRRGRPQGREDR